VKAAHTVIAVVIGALSCVGAASQTAAPAQVSELALLLDMKGNAAQGKEVFTACQDCHRKDGSGRANGVFPRLAGQHGLVMIKQLSDIRSGRRNNPSMQALAAALSRTELVDVVAYLATLPISDKNGKGPGTALELGKQLYDRDCASCHGPNGEGVAAKFYPMVAAQHYQYLLREVISIRDGERGNSNPEMVLAIKNYGKADFEAVADYMTQLPPPRARAPAQ
jgi:cytochrome c553